MSPCTFLFSIELKKKSVPSCPQDLRIIAIANACAEFDHIDDARHNVELQEGSANTLCELLAVVAPSKYSKLSSNDTKSAHSINDDEIRMILAALEMVFRGHSSYVRLAFDKCGTQMLPLLLRLLERAESGKLKHADSNILNISKILLYISRVPEQRGSLARDSNVLNALQRVATPMLNPESRVIRVRIIANLVNAGDETKRLLLEHEGLLDSLLHTAHLDVHDQAREYANVALVDLAGASCNQVAMANNEKVGNDMNESFGWSDF
jgi:hypothetical protein